MRKTSKLIATSLVAATLVVAAPVSAQRASLAERVALLEQQAGNNQMAIDLLRQVNLLKEEVVALRSQVEQLTHEQEQLKATARAQYLDLDSRLARLEGGEPAALSGDPVSTNFDGEAGAAAIVDAPAADAAAAATAGAPAEPGPTVYGDPGKLDAIAGEREAYDLAFDALKAGQYAESARLFQSFLGHFPGGVYAPNALYWLGESYYVTQNYKLALEQFEAVLQRYPTHDKAPGALLKVGLSQQGLDQLDAAERTLAEVARRYPGTDAARVAADRLGAIELGRLR